MEQSKQSRTGYLAIICLLALALGVVLYLDRCNPGHPTAQNPQSSGSDTTKPGGVKTDTINIAGTLLTGTVLEISNSNPPVESAEANDQLAYIYSNTTPIPNKTNGSGEVQIKISGIPSGGPVYLEAEQTSVNPGNVCARMINTLTGTTLGDTGAWQPTIIVPQQSNPAGPVFVKIYATDMQGNAYSGASVQLYTGNYTGTGTGNTFGNAIKTSTDGKGCIKYASKLALNTTYTVGVTGGTSINGNGGASYFTILTTPKSCTGCQLSGVEVFMHY